VLDEIKHCHRGGKMGDSKTISVPMPTDEHDFIRNFDPEKMAITFYGDECLVLPVVDAVKQLEEKVTVEAANKRWLLPF
jgi:hypothetical protein